MRLIGRGWIGTMVLLLGLGLWGCQQDENLPNYTAATQNKQQGASSSSSSSGSNGPAVGQDRMLLEGFAHGGGVHIPVLQLGLIEVGQGDCFVVGTPEGKVYLVDGGPAGAEATVVPLLQRSGVEQLAGVFITNWNADHTGALPQILGAFPCGNVYGPDLKTNTPAENAVRDLLAIKGKTVLPMHAGGIIMLDERVKMEILAPTTPTERGNLDAVSWINTNSVVLRAIFGDSRILFTSSMSPNEREKLLATDTDLRTPVLVLADHGSRRGTDIDLLAKVTPTLVLLSCGSGNAEGTPHAEVIQALKQRSVSFARTDLQGTIFIRCEENGHISAQPSRPSETDTTFQPGKVTPK